MSSTTDRSSSRRRTPPPAPAAPAPDAGPLEIALEEERLCDKVVDHLSSIRPSKPPQRFDEQSTLLALRDQIASSRLEDVPALIQQMSHVQALANQRAQHVVEPVDRQSPYFGHLKLREHGRGVRDVLIGKTTYLEPRADVRIVDWRHAPISSLYYRYEEGARYEELFGDREVEGEIVARRTVTIRDGKLERVTAPQGLFVRDAAGWRCLPVRAVKLEGGEGSAIRAEHFLSELSRQLGETSAAAEELRGRLGGRGLFEQREDRHLPEIAALLDPRQFELITKADSGLVVVKGAAGSGKTTIGVHRMAFLAYQSPTRFAAERMLVVVGTPALQAYISQLLDALGLGAVRVVTFGAWAAQARRHHFGWLDLPIEENTPAEVSRLKGDPVVLHLLERKAQLLGDELGHDARGALALWAEVLTDRQGLLDAFARRPGALLSPSEIERAWSYCSDRCPAVTDWSTPDAVGRQLAVQEEDPDADVGADGVEEHDERARLDPEDDALLLRAYQLMAGPVLARRHAPGIEHLFVDEAQDLAPVEISVLLGLVGDGQSVTLAGDTGQRLRMDTGFGDWQLLLEDLGLSHVAVEPLRVAYRSTREVMQFARDVLGPLADPEIPVAPRSGAPVEHHRFPGTGAAAAFLAEALRPLFVREPRATVAVLTRYAEQAEAYYDALEMAEVPRLSLVRDYDFSFHPGVEVTEIRQVKGLEYDYVVLVDVNAQTYPDDDESRYLLHIGATRAAHQLWIVSTGTLSPLIPAWLGE